MSSRVREPFKCTCWAERTSRMRPSTCVSRGEDRWQTWWPVPHLPGVARRALKAVLGSAPCTLAHPRGPHNTSSILLIVSPNHSQHLKLTESTMHVTILYTGYGRVHEQAKVSVI